MSEEGSPEELSEEKVENGPIPVVKTAKGYSVKNRDDPLGRTQTTQEGSDKSGIPVEDTGNWLPLDNTQRTPMKPKKDRTEMTEEDMPTRDFLPKTVGRGSRERMDLKTTIQLREQLKRDRIEKERKERQQKIRRIARFAVTVIIGLELLTIILYVLAIFIINGMLKSTKVEPWIFQPEPSSYIFKEFAASSNSESCNEEARTLHLANHSIYGIAFAMSLCLMKNAPHRGGLGGASVAVMVDLEKNLCQQTQGYPRWPAWLNLEGNRSSNHAHNDHWSHVVLQPGESNTWNALLSRIDKEERRKLHHKIFGEHARIFAIDEHLAQHLRIMDTMLALLSTYDYLLTDDHYGKLEGDLAEMPLKIGEIGADQDKWSWKSQSLLDMFPDLDYVFDHFDGEYDDWINGELEQIGQYKVCTASKPKNSSIVLDALRKWEETELRTQVENMHFEPYIAMEKAIQHAKESLYYHTLDRDEVKRLDDDIRHANRRIIRKDFPYSANFFALVNLKKQQAIACTSTIGSSFGSLINSNGSVILNNLVRFAIIPDNELGEMDAFLFQPLIAFKKSISAVWAGTGGSARITLDMPRMVTAFIWRLFDETPLLHGSGSPMIFPKRSKYTAYNEGFEWGTLMRLQSPINKWLLDRNETERPLMRIPNDYTRHTRMDSAAVIDTNEEGLPRSFLFSNSERVMPSGV